MKGVICTMRNWKHIEWSNSFVYGVDVDESHYIMTEIQGWNDNETFSDIDELMTIRSVIFEKDNGLDVMILQHYLSDDVKYNLQVRRIYKEVEQKMREEILNYLRQDNLEK
jgi:hypothetical protein